MYLQTNKTYYSYYVRYIQSFQEWILLITTVQLENTSINDLVISLDRLSLVFFITQNERNHRGGWRGP